MLAKLRPRLTYANVVSSICLCLVVGGGTAYAADSVFSVDIVDGEVKTVDLANSAVTGGKLANNTVNSSRVVDNSLGAVDLAPDSVDTSEVVAESLRGSDVAENTIRGADVDEDDLDVPEMGCQSGKVNGYARIKGSASMISSYAHSRVDQDDSCNGAPPLARRASVGVYYVYFYNTPAELAVAIPNSDGSSTSTAVRDNIVSVAKVPLGSCEDCGSFRIQVEDVSASGSGTVPTDGWFTIMVM